MLVQVFLGVPHSFINKFSTKGISTVYSLWADRGQRHAQVHHATHAAAPHLRTILARTLWAKGLRQAGLHLPGYGDPRR